MIKIGKIRTGIEPLDFGVPEGILRSSTIVISGPAGTGKSVLVAHFAKNMLERGEPVVYLTLDDDPRAVIELFSNFKWDVDGYIEKISSK